MSDTNHELETMQALRKIQEQLGFLEKKIDTLLSQSQSGSSQERSFNSEKRFSRPFRPYNNSGPSRDGGDRPRSYGGDRPYGKRDFRGQGGGQGGNHGNQEFRPKKKPFFGRRPD